MAKAPSVGVRKGDRSHVLCHFVGRHWRLMEIFGATSLTVRENEARIVASLICTVK
ncbi:hypothetical protein [Citrobacter freundii]|uniref:hypothetical protein n=1 Tax=Citrobacter freundii TaxID=546 RepID=UPI001A29FBC8|nr:hypothetical protein [Citrobacter freundii]EKD2602306.1 hypothetical protein [Escherichia coli]MDT7231420.1 hypothetical protein [Citrobacter freundii]HAT3664696.1 hypothetical protein [Citrobacter freundii]HBH6882428.1 hypothetical protein [Citrobacter freundii]HBH6985739.1 hypothetical protein [Citrobacter freundii]